MTPKAEPLTQFLDRHRGEVAWLFGKGPSLDAFDFTEAGPLRCGINDIAAIVPGCRYGFAHDDTREWADLYEGLPDFLLFQPWRTAIDAVDPPCQRHVFRDKGHFDWDRPRERFAEEGLCHGRGSLSGALQILWIMGVAEIRCVGIDGGGGHAARSPRRTPLMNEHDRIYDDIRQEFIRRAIQIGMEVRFHGARTEPETRGYMKIQVIRDTFSRGDYLREGLICELPLPEARELLHAGAAVPYMQGAPIETATAEPSMEAPEAPAERKRTKRQSVKKAKA